MAPKLASWAAEQARKAQLPQKPEDYALVNSAGFKPPAGLEVKWDPADPIVAQARAWAKENNLTQEAFAKGLDIFAARDVGTEQKIQTARNAELAKLGATVTARVDAIDTFMKAMVGEEGAGHIRAAMATAGFVTTIEKLMARFVTQGSAGFKQSGREPPDQPGRLPAEQVEKMSGYEKLNYARSFDQSQFRKAG